MAPSVIAIGLDAADPDLVERWLAHGALPHIAQLQASGAYGRLHGRRTFRAETAWTTFLTGCDAEQTGYWTGLVFDARTYGVTDTGAYDFDEYPPFYTLGAGHRVAVFDIPQSTLCQGVDGIQVVAWGAHSPMHQSCSEPPELLEQLIRLHGQHPALNRDHATFWNPFVVAWLQRALSTGIARRAAICRDLLAREKWDLFLTVFGETHTAGHYFWHTGNSDHPLNESRGLIGDAARSTPLLTTFQAVDRAVGELARASPADSYMIVYSIHGMESNSMDLPSMVFLPELLYRLAFPGQAALALSPAGGRLLDPERSPRSLSWQRALWSRKHDGPAMLRALRRVMPIEISYALEKLFGVRDGLAYPSLSTVGPLWYQPAMWYRSGWPEMRAFALPSFSEGYVRLNVVDRERDGIVNASAYESVCDEITAEILGMRNARTGEPVAEQVIRTRQTPFESVRAPDADLIVVWNSAPTDVVDSKGVGRIGPVPYGRTGSHVNRGFLFVKGPGIAPGSRLPAGDVKDLAPTILTLCGADVPATLEGRTLVERRQIAAE